VNGSSQPEAVVLYGRSSFDKTQALPAIAARLEPRPGEGAHVAVAFADLTGPSLPDVPDRLAGEGVTAATIVPCMIPADPSLSVWLAGALSLWSRRVADHRSNGRSSSA